MFGRILAQSLDRCESNCRCYNGIVWSNYAVPRCLRTPRCLRNSRDPRVINSNYPVLFLTSYQVYTYTVPLTIVKSSQWNKTEGSSIPRTPSLNEPPISSRFSLISRPIKRTNVKPDYLSIMCTHTSPILSLSRTTNVNRNYPKVAGMLLRYFFRRARYSPCSRDFYDFYIYMCVFVLFGCWQSKGWMKCRCIWKNFYDAYLAYFNCGI